MWVFHAFIQRHSTKHRVRKKNLWNVIYRKKSKENFKRSWKTLAGRKRTTSKNSRLAMKDSGRTEKDSRRVWLTVFGKKGEFQKRWLVKKDRYKKIFKKS